MSMTHEPGVLNPELRDSLAALQALLHQAATDGTPLHQVELTIWKHVLQIGRQSLRYFLALQGDGDCGQSLTWPDQSQLERLAEPHTRRYVSVFGEFLLRRVVYGSREGQKIDFVPLDNRLQLPQSPFSYLLQDWDQALAAEQAFGQVQATIARILGLSQSVASLEGMNLHMAQSATPYRLNRPMPPADEEGEHVVKDRKERAGMHWTRAGAEAMLEVRSQFVSDCWEAFQAFRIEQETNRLYPHRALVEGAGFMMAA